jgi:hypothetical protein
MLFRICTCLSAHHTGCFNILATSWVHTHVPLSVALLRNRREARQTLASTMIDLMHVCHVLLFHGVVVGTTPRLLDGSVLRGSYVCINNP